jgi:hypothetical protein
MRGIFASRRREAIAAMEDGSLVPLPREAPWRPPKRRPPGGNPAANFNGIGNISNAPKNKRKAAKRKHSSGSGR